MATKTVKAKATVGKPRRIKASDATLERRLRAGPIATTDAARAALEPRGDDAAAASLVHAPALAPAFGDRPITRDDAVAFFRNVAQALEASSDTSEHGILFDRALAAWDAFQRQVPSERETLWSKRAASLLATARKQMAKGVSHSAAAAAIVLNEQTVASARGDNLGAISAQRWSAALATPVRSTNGRRRAGDDSLTESEILFRLLRGAANEPRFTNATSAKNMVDAMANAARRRARTQR